MNKRKPSEEASTTMQDSELKYLYTRQKLSTYEIARITGMPRSTVQLRLKKLIVLRTPREAKIAKQEANMAKLGMGGEVRFTCRICHRTKPISELVRDPRYFPVVYCCNKCA